MHSSDRLTKTTPAQRKHTIIAAHTFTNHVHNNHQNNHYTSKNSCKQRLPCQTPAQGIALMETSSQGNVPHVMALVRCYFTRNMENNTVIIHRKHPWEINTSTSMTSLSQCTSLHRCSPAGEINIWVCASFAPHLFFSHGPHWWHHHPPKKMLLM